MTINNLTQQTVTVEKEIGRYHQLRDGTPYHIKTGLDLPDLFKQTLELNKSLWPKFIQENPTTENFYELYARFPAYQFALVTEDETVIAVGNSVPLAWEGDPHDLPASGWDWAYKQAFSDDDDGKTPTIQSALAITVAPNFLGQGVSQEAFLAMKSLGKKAGLTALIAPVRPNQKHAYPLIDMYDYLQWVRDDGQPFDAWVRTHTRLGGKIIKPALRSMHITGSVADWERWSGLTLPKSGEYIVPKALAPIQIDIETDLGVYLEPNVWIWHPMDVDLPERESAVSFSSQAKPLTAEQRQIWFAEKLHPDTSMYTNSFLFSFEGEIDYPRFNQAFQALVKHSDILRTIIVTKSGEPKQTTIKTNASLPLLEDIADVEAWASARTRHHRFDFAQPMFESALLQSTSGNWHWYISLHHIIGDGWTLQLLLDRMSSLYTEGNSASKNWPQFLPMVDIINQADNQEADAYWREKTNRDLDEPAFYGSKTNATAPQFERVWVDLGTERIAKLHQALQDEQLFIQNKNISLYNSMMAITATWLSRIGRLTDFAIGSPLLTRPTAKLRQTAGMISRYVPLHFHIDKQDSFVSLIQQAATESRVCNKHNIVPVPSEGGERPFSVSLNLRPLRHLTFANQPVQSYWPSPDHSLNDLSIQVLHNADKEQIQLAFDFNKTIFDNDDQAAAIRHFTTLIDSFIANPNQPIATAPMLSETETQEILLAWNDTDKIYPHNVTAHELFEIQAAYSPNATALKFGDDHLTYAELNERANQLAHYLRECGVTTADTLVAVFTERSFETIISMLAVLKAGGAYVSLDPSNPPSRLAYMLDDADVSIILTQSHLKYQLPETSTTILANVINVDDWLQGKPYSTENLPPISQPTDLAYVIYTSGSTGQPKGVMVEHRNVTNLIFWMKETYPLGINDRLLQKTPYSFDVSVREILFTLATGATLVLAKHDGHKDAAYLAKIIEQEQISTLHFVPSLLSLFLQAATREQTKSLKWITSGGEALPPNLRDKVLEKFGVPVVNMYGPTEAAVDVTIYHCDPDKPRDIVPIGFPTPNSQLYILDKQLNPVPAGVIGDLYIGGSQVARGYLNQPELTSERFLDVESEKWKVKSEESSPLRLYKTGDLARYAYDGAIIYVGRSDFQVKLRGFRIELGEINATMLAHDGVRESAVIVRNDNIIAYIVPEQALPSDNTLRQHCKTNLPDYMMPAAFVQLDALPLTPNGKLDRRALPDPDFATIAAENYVAPTSALENSLAFIWSNVLGQEKISTTANFFHLGGHSLLATRIINEANSLLQTNLSLAAVFQAPSIQQLAHLIDSSQQEAIKTDSSLDVNEVDYAQSYALSPAQERLWFAYKLDPKNVTYNVSTFLKLSGKLNTSALNRAFATLIQRHAILRTLVKEHDDQPLQHIQDITDVEIDTVAVFTLAKMRMLGDAFHNRPFNLSTVLPIRAQLFHLQNSNTHILQTTFHHIAFDGWSSQIFEQELGALYAEFADNKSANLPAMATQYIDYAHSAKAWQQSKAHDEQLAYWTQQLVTLPTLNLPIDFPRPAVQSNSGRIYRLKLPNALREALNSFSKENGLSKFAVLSTIFNLLLHRYTGQTDIAIGIPVANRPNSDSEKMIGFFVNSIVLRTQISDSDSFVTLANSVSKTLVEGFANQRVSFDTLASTLIEQRDPSRHPFFQVMFDMQRAEEEKRPFGTLTAETHHQDWQTAKFDLDFSIRDHQDDMQVWVEYNTDLFKPSTIERMVDHFAILAAAATTQPSAPIASLSLLSAKEKQFILHTVNDTQMALPATNSIVPVFEELVSKYSDEIAIIHNDSSLTYQQLNERVNQVAHFLRACGISQNTPVGLHVTHSIDMVVGMLAVLKSGGSYVPLDPNYPQDRLAYILNEANISLVLTQSVHENLLPACPQVIALDQMMLSTQTTGDNLRVAHDKDDIAYIIFTSGSTGKPKGVQVRHHGLLNHAIAIQDEFCLSADDNVLQFASVSFDVAGEEIFPTLLSGATVVLRNDTIMNSFESFGLFMNTHQISVANLPTPFWQAWVNALADGDALVPDKLRLMIIGSDKASPHSVQKWFATVGNKVRWLNAYGLTETTITSTIYEPEPNEDLNVAIVPIGKPIGNTQIYILDKQFNPVPIGATGTLFIGGFGLAHGYLNRPSLTEDKFINVDSGKWSAESGVDFSHPSSLRLYNTGDLARLREDGNIEFLGRDDFQVKIRGFRIELGEVEVAISDISAVTECVVVDHKDTNDHVSLVAYIVAEPTVDVDQLHEGLKHKLPAYMVPTTIIRLEKMPLTLNGKIDRKQLPLPAQKQRAKKSAVPPKNQVEATLINIWSDVLGVDVDRNDNYFQLGGDSILSIRIISRARKAGIQFTPKQLFENPTIARLRHVAKSKTKSKAELVKEMPLEDHAELLPIQHWFFEQAIPNIHHWNMASLFAISADFDITCFDQALTHIVEHHDALRLRFVNTANGWSQLYAQETTLIETASIDLRAENNPQKQIQETAETLHNSLNIHNGPLLRTAHFALPDGTNQLLIIIHHLVVDGVSWRILREDIETVYTQLKNQETVSLPDKTLSTGNWATQLKGYANSFALIDEQKYWSSLSSVRYKSLPLDFKDSQANTVGNSAILSKTLDKQTTDALLKIVPTAYNTQINDALLTALSLAMRKWTGQNQLLLAMEGHGREDIGSDADLSRSVGWFTSQYPVLLTLSDPNNIGDSLKQIKEQLRAIPSNGLSFDALRYLHSSNDVRLQLFNVPSPELLFNYLGQMNTTGSPSLLQPIQGEIGRPFDPDSPRSTLLDLNAVVINGEMTLNWRYSTTHHKPQTIESLADGYIEELHTLIKHCQRPENSGFTPSDFPDSGLNQAELDRLFTTMDAGNIDAIFPLSPMQEGMLFHSLQSEGRSYFAQTQYVVRGKVNVDAFKQAFKTIYDRHAALRTKIVWQKLERPLQIVLQDVEPAWHEYDWRTLTDIERTTELFELLGQDEQLGIDLSEAPLGRLYLIRLEDDLYHFIRSSHHITGDGWSGGVMFADFHKLYEAYDHVQQIELDPARSYHDFIRWLNKRDHHASETFWRKELAGFSAPTPLTIDKPAANSERNKTYSELLRHFPADFSDRLRGFAQQQELTPNTLVQAAWGMLLNRYSQESDVLFGATVSGRPAELDDVENMMGAFINTVPIRIKVDEKQSLRHFLRELQQRQAVINQYEHESLVNMQAWSSVPRDEPLFETILVVESFASGNKKQSDEGISIESVTLNTTTGYPLTVAVNPSGDWELKVVYENGRFASADIKRLLTHFQTLLESIIVATETATLGSLTMLPQEETTHILQAINNRATTHIADASVIETFEQTADTLPDNIAISQNEHTITYQVLNERINQLAHALVQNGITPETYIGLYINRSPELIIAMLAILKAGGAFVPMDADYPQSRIAHMINDSKLTTIITTKALAKKLPKTTATIQYIDDNSNDHFPVENLAKKPASDQLAYLLYTSGSTGKPKGVMIEHGSLLNLAEHYHQTMNITPDTRLLQFCAPNFDASLMDIFSCFNGGGRLMLRTNDMMHVPTFIKKSADWGITNVLLPTAFWHELTAVMHEQPNLKLPSALKHVIVGGEKALRQRLALWQEMVGDSIQFYNAYGPTETTVAATMVEMTAKDLSTERELSIGRPLTNVDMFILDKQQRIVPIGMPGELHIGGIQVARGYWEQPTLTAEKFINIDSKKWDMQREKASSLRLYKTGDLVRFWPDGHLEFLGRTDDQVKVRGFRIELGGIESTLTEHPSIQDCAVIAVDVGENDTRLAAYVVTQSGKDTETAILRAHLKQTLPSYMVPAAFMTLDSLPMTPGGKINRNALPEPIFTLSTDAEHISPRTQTEQTILTIWEELLNVSHISMNDDWFDLGGHSLLAVRMTARIDKAIGETLSVNTLAEHRTIAQLAKLIDTEEVDNTWSLVVPLEKGGDKPPFFMLHANSGVLFYRKITQFLSPDQPVYGIQAPGINDGEQIPVTIEEKIALYIKEIQRVQPHGPYHFGGYSLGGILAYEMAQQFTAMGEEVGLAAIIETGPNYTRYARNENLSQKIKRNVDNQLLRLRALGTIERQLDYVKRRTRARIAAYRGRRIQSDLQNKSFSQLTLPQRYDVIKLQMVEAVSSYRIKPYVGRITVFKAEMQPPAAPHPETYLTWDDLVQGEVDWRTVPGDHGSILERPAHAEQLAKAIQTSLNNASLQQSVVNSANKQRGN